MNTNGPSYWFFRAAAFITTAVLMVITIIVQAHDMNITELIWLLVGMPTQTVISVIFIEATADLVIEHRQRQTASQESLWSMPNPNPEHLN